jgi:phage terminase large subunit-like protein
MTVTAQAPQRTELVNTDSSAFSLVQYMSKYARYQRYLATYGNPAASELRRTLTRSDPLLFAYLYLRHHLRYLDPDTGQWGEVTFADFHLDLVNDAVQWMKTGDITDPARDLYVAPRECGKSTWLFLILPLWAAAHGHISFVAAFSDTTTTAEEHLSSFKHELEQNDYLRADYPELCRPKVRQRGVTLSDNRGKIHTESDFVFIARGIDSSNLGMKVDNRRPDLILLDDIEPKETSYSEDLVAKRLLTLRDTILPLNRRARVAWVGTVTMYGSLVHQHVRVVTRPHEKKADWIAELRFKTHYYAPIVERADGSRRSMWPGSWPLPWLAEQEGTQEFAKNFQNDPSDNDGAWWRESDFKYGQPFMGLNRTVLVVDGAVTTKKTSDFTGMAVVGMNYHERKIYIREAIAVKISGQEFRQKVLDLVSEFDVDYVMVESNQGGDLWYTVLHDMPVKVTTYTQSENKQIRLKRLLATYQRSERPILHEKVLPDLTKQALRYPHVSNDDVLDAVAAGVEHNIAMHKRTIGSGTMQSQVSKVRRR